jgi:hypothetical protein
MRAKLLVCGLPGAKAAPFAAESTATAYVGRPRCHGSRLGSAHVIWSRLQLYHAFETTIGTEGADRATAATPTTPAKPQHLIIALI